MDHLEENQSLLQKAAGEMLAMDLFVARLRQTAVVWLRRIAIWGVGIAIAIAIVVVLAFKVANAQTTVPMVTIASQTASACYTLTYTQNLKGDYRKLLQAKCDAEIREAKGLAKTDTTPVVSSIGVATKNVAVTTVTYRDNTGKALEGSSGWAKHEEKMADINKKKEVGVEKAKNPGCGWMGCAAPYGYGGYGGGYGYSSGYYGGGYTPINLNRPVVVTGRGEGGSNIVF